MPNSGRLDENVAAGLLLEAAERAGYKEMVPNAPRPEPPSPAAARFFASIAVLAVVGTWVAAQIDFFRRHTLGSPPVPPMRYWLPQLTHIWLPGLGAALVCAATAFALHRRGRSD